jgi:hypothetical protein
MPITEEENAKIQEELDKQIEEQTPVEEAEEAKPEEEQPAIEDTEEQPKPYWELRGFKSESEFIKSFENAQSMIGKQATEIGDLRSKVTATPVKEEAVPEFDPYDKANLETHVERKVREALEKATQEREARESSAKAEESRLKMVGKFIEAHKDELDQAKLEAVAIYARDNGIRDLEDAYIVMNAKKPRSEVKPVSTKAKDINDLPNTLADVGAADKKGDDVAAMSQEEYNKLPQDKREELLRNA